MKKINIKNKKILIPIACVIIMLVILITILFISNKGKDKNLLGTWSTKGNTIYEFEKKGKGKMIVPLKEYVFTYKIEDNKLYIDYEDESANDAEYEYTIEKNKLTIKGERGTFKLTKNN